MNDLAFRTSKLDPCRNTRTDCRRDKIDTKSKQAQTPEAKLMLGYLSYQLIKFGKFYFTEIQLGEFKFFERLLQDRQLVSDCIFI